MKFYLFLLVSLICINVGRGPHISKNQEIKKTIYFELSGGATIKMIWVEPGTFLMGSPVDENGRTPEREKQHEVKISKGFWLAETEFTQEQWKKVMGNNPSKHKGSNLPVEQVSYNDIEVFLTKINKEYGRFRLPTEAEWEYACRANTTDMYSGARDEMAWHRGNSNVESHPITLKQPNAWGFYDMHGNILEKCSDWFQEDNTSESVNPKGPITGGKRVERGGQFTGRIRHTRSADRQRSSPESRDFYVGFRLARSAD